MAQGQPRAAWRARLAPLPGEAGPPLPTQAPESWGRSSCHCRLPSCCAWDLPPSTQAACLTPRHSESSKDEGTESSVFTYSSLLLGQGGVLSPSLLAFPETWTGFLESPEGGQWEGHGFWKSEMMECEDRATVRLSPSTVNWGSRGFGT